MSGSSLYTSPSGSGQAAAPSRMEQLYNTAVQSFVRRDHVQAHAALGELLGMVRASHAKAQAQAQEGQGTRAWWELEPDLSGSVRPSGVDETDTADTADTMDTVDAEWTVKILKLYISACASTYADPPSQPGALPPTIRGLLPPKPADRILCHARDVCGSFYPESDNASASPARSSFADPLDPSAAPTPTSTALLPPPLISTLVLASLKLAPPALSFAHSTAEAWLAALPDAFVMHIGPASPLLRPSTAGFLSAAERRRLEGAREGYVRVVELFVGEVLGREEEWEMARGVLDGESVMSSKRKEVGLGLGLGVDAAHTRRERGDRIGLMCAEPVQALEGAALPTTLQALLPGQLGRPPFSFVVWRPTSTLAAGSQWARLWLWAARTLAVQLRLVLF